jgi:cytochrome c553
MRPIAEALTGEERKAVASYYASVADAPYPPPPQVAALTLQRGGAISAVGLPEQGVPACQDCHGPSGVGRPPDYPSLAGQYADYLALQLWLWKKGERGGGPGSEVMADIAAALTDEQIDAVSLYFASVRPSEAILDKAPPKPGAAGTPAE